MNRSKYQQKTLETGQKALAKRELEILKLIAAGFENRRIAQTLDLSVQTVRNHTNRIYEKLGIPNEPGIYQRVRAVLLFLEEC